MGIALLCFLLRVIVHEMIAPTEVDEVEQRLLRFGRYWENRFVSQRWEKLHGCLPTLHQLRHCAQAIRWDGPMVGYAQWSMEILNGIVSRATKSRVQVNASIATRGLLCEQENHLSYVRELPDFQRAPGQGKCGRGKVDETSGPAGRFLILRVANSIRLSVA